MGGKVSPTRSGEKNGPASASSKTLGSVLDGRSPCCQTILRFTHLPGLQASRNRLYPGFGLNLWILGRFCAQHLFASAYSLGCSLTTAISMRRLRALFSSVVLGTAGLYRA